MLLQSLFFIGLAVSLFWFFNGFDWLRRRKTRRYLQQHLLEASPPVEVTHLYEMLEEEQFAAFYTAITQTDDATIHKIAAIKPHKVGTLCTFNRQYPNCYQGLLLEIAKGK